MYPPQETNGEVRDLGSLVLPALAIKVGAGVAKIEELANERTVPEVEMRRLLSAVAENVYAHTLLSGVSREMIAMVERVEVALRKTPIELHLDDAFSRVYHRLRNGQYHRAAITRLAQANEARCLALTLDNACLAIRLQAGDESFRTSLALRIQSVVERAELEHRDASAAAEEFATYGGDDNASVAGELWAAIGRVLDNREQQEATGDQGQGEAGAANGQQHG